MTNSLLSLLIKGRNCLAPKTNRSSFPYTVLAQRVCGCHFGVNCKLIELFLKFCELVLVVVREVRFSKMPDARNCFVLRVLAAEVLQEPENDSDSGDNDLYSGSESDEEYGELFLSVACDALENDR